MAKINEETMRELDDILNENTPDVNRLNAFIKLKATRNQIPSPKNLFGSCDISFDVDVDLTKLPGKQYQQHKQQHKKEKQESDQCKGTKNLSKEEALRKKFNESVTANVQHLMTESEPELELPVTPRHSIRGDAAVQSPPSKISGTVSDSDTLIRASLHRNSQTFDCRVLRKTLSNINESRKTSGSFAFIPQVSSTPASERPQAVKPIRQMTEKSKSSSKRTLPEKSTGTNQLETLERYRNLEATFEASLRSLTSNVNSPLNSSQINAVQQSSKNTVNSTTRAIGDKQGTFVIENKIETEQMTENPSMGQQTSMPATTVESQNSDKSIRQRQPRVLLKRHCSMSQADVSTSRIQSASYMAPDENVTSSQPRLVLSRTAEFLTSNFKTRQTEAENNGIDREVVPQSHEPRVDLLDQPETPPAAVSCGIQTTHIPSNSKVSDESNLEDSEKSTAPLNLAPAAGNTTRQLRRRKEVTYSEATPQLLDLHRTRKSDVDRQEAHVPLQAILNKPNLPPINGEQFAEELARMSNCEILDLRKRNSLGRLCHQEEFTAEQQVALEHSIQIELLRRNLSDCSDALPGNIPGANGEREPPAQASGERKNNSNSRYSNKSRQQHMRKSRLKPKSPPMTAELQKYLSASQILKNRLNSYPRSDTKRSLYTKGQSDNEENILQSPAKDLSSNIQIAPSPPSHLHSSLDMCDIPIVPPPPASCRYSRQSRLSDKQPAVDVVEAQNACAVAESSRPEILDDVQIVPPPPISMRYSRQNRRSSLGAESQNQSSHPSSQDVRVTLTPRTPSKSLQRSPSRPTGEISTANVGQEQNEVRSNDALEEEEVVIQPPSNTSIQGTDMEELRVESPTPPNPLDEQPSTSKAARAALEMSNKMRSKQKRPNQQQKPKPNDEAIFKKPLVPPKEKILKKKNAHELKNLHIGLKNKSLLPEDDEGDNNETNGVRRSKRGHVPLRNTWVHTVSEPFKSTFFERSILGTQTRNKSKPKTARTRRGSVINQTPICSSTPCDGDAAATNGEASKAYKRKRNEEPILFQWAASNLTTIPEREDLEQRTENRKRNNPNKDQNCNEECPRKRLRCRLYSGEISNSDSMSFPEPFAPQTPDGPELTSAAECLAGIQAGMLEPSEKENCESDNNLIRLSRLDDLKFINMDGLEYGFYMTEENCAMGLIRFQPLQERGIKRNKTNILRFLAMLGEFTIEIVGDSSNTQKRVMKSGDFVEIPRGTRFNITNNVNEISLMLVNRK